MKRRLLKLISAVLIIASLISASGVFSYAAFGDDGEIETLELRVNRTYDEGWNYNNGVTVSNTYQKIEITYEENADFTYNYYTKFTVLDNPPSSNDAFFAIDGGSFTTGGFVMEFDLKVESFCNLGSLAYGLTESASATRSYITFFTIQDNTFYSNAGANFKWGELSEEWVHVALVMNFDQSVLSCHGCNGIFPKNQPGGCPNCPDTTAADNVITFRTYYSTKDAFDYENCIDASEANGNFDFDKYTYYYDSSARVKADRLATMYVIRFGIISGTESNLGDSICVDNLLVYSDTDPRDENGNSVPMDIIEGMNDVEKYGYGSKVSESQNKPINILGGGEAKDFLGEGVVMKLGSNYMLANNKRKAIFTNSETGKAYGAPGKVNGIVYVPFEAILESTGYPVFVHDDGISYDISTAKGTSSLAIGRDTAVVNGEKIPLAAAPILLRDPDDESNTYPAIAMEDVEKFFQGYYVDYDEMGLLAVTEAENVFDRNSDLKYMIEIMKSFIFDYTEEEEMFEMLKENTNNFDHPYLLADEDTFKYMRDVWDGNTEDDFYRTWLEKFVKEAEGNFTKFTRMPANPANYTFKTPAYENTPNKYQYLAFEITNPYYGIKDGQVWSDKPELGYDYCGPADENGDYWGKKGSHYNDGYDWAYNQHEYLYTGAVRSLALGYRITGDMRYAELAYDVLVSLCDYDNWHNWHHKCFLLTSQALVDVALAYDWLYDVWAEIQYERGEEYRLDYIVQRIYKNTFYYGYDISRYGKTSDVWTRDRYGITTDWNWSETEINWNCVCSGGLVIGAMAFAGEEERLGLNFTEKDDNTNRLRWCMRNNLWKLANYGLSQYAPDGSYIESAGYWGYATNNFAKMLWAMDTALGDDLGLYETWGLDKTFYFAIEVEASVNGSYNIWAYHDGSNQTQSTELFFFASEMLNDQALATIRMDQIRNGKGVCWEDVVGYKPEYKDLDIADVVLERDWALEACDGVVARSSWEKDSLFMGIMGGKNNFGNHAHMDSGIFTYVNNGVNWFPDIGTDTYSLYNFFELGYRQHYYRMGVEGHNLIAITSLPDTMPYGQNYAGGGVMQEIYYGGDAGMYGILDNSGAYGDITNYARRGMLLTNNRTTAVIQDEIAFKGVQSCVWIAHTEANITLSGDGKTAILSKVSQGKTQFLRVTLYSSNSKLKFEVMTCGVGQDDFLFDATHRPGYSESHGQIKENDRSKLRRLVIKADNTLSFDCAIVMETISKADDERPVEYDYTPMSRWTVSESYEGGVESGTQQGSNVISNAKMTDIKSYTAQAAKLVETGYAFTNRTADFFKALARVTVAVNTYRPETFKNIPQIYSAYEEYLNYIAKYNAYKDHINDASWYSALIGRGLSLTK